MKKRGLIFGIVLILFISLSFVSASGFSDFWDRLTGKVTTEICTDTDGGKNYYVSGGVSISSVLSQTIDSCSYYSNTGEYILHEMYCDNETIAYEEHTCPYGCANGACVSDPSQALYSCMDSDGRSDNVHNLKCIIKESMRGLNNTATDTCINNNTLLEYFCSWNLDNMNSSEIYNCPNGCKDGACIKLIPNQTQTTPSCVDTDGGKDYYVFGYATTDGGFHQSKDSCTHDLDLEKWILYEHYCEGNSIKWIAYTCPEECINGACVSKGTDTPCVDSDKGQNYYIKGKTQGRDWVTSDFVVNEDYCITKGDKIGNVVEFFCMHNEVVFNDSYHCSDGCENGACIKTGENASVILQNDTESVGIEENASVIIPPNNKPVEMPEGNASCAGCQLENKCYPFGYRKSGKYCSDTEQFLTQLKLEKSCDNNFECSSNVCVNGNCISATFLQKILNFFKGLFGKE
jgi:hypothetical protein